MIRVLTGTVISQNANSLVIDTGGVGYVVYCPSDIALNTAHSEHITLWTHLAVRENSLDLYGFTSEENVQLFELLLTVSGIGPKSALGILNVADANALKNAVAAGDTSHLVKVSGIGKKNAEKIVLELRGKLEAVDEEAGTYRDTDSETFEALTSLGYSASEARDAVRNLPTDITDTGERIKEALKNMGA
ncbi:MAG: Holliday junction branch migration protein RuvA [Candidatus Paceibacterota bacterium]